MDVSTEAGGSPNGAPNDSASGTSPNAAPGTQPGRKSRRARSDAARKKANRRAKETILAAAADAALARALGSAKHRLVAPIIQKVRADREEVARAAGAPVVARSTAAEQRRLSLAGKKSVLVEFRIFKACLVTTPGAKEFLQRARGASRLDTVRNVVAEITPKLLAHNGPLLKRVTTALQKYDDFETTRVASKAVADDSSRALRLALGRLACSVRALSASVILVRSLAEREQLAANAKPKRKRAA